MLQNTDLGEAKEMKKDTLGLLVTFIFITFAVVVLIFIFSSNGLFLTSTSNIETNQVPDDIEIVSYEAFTIEGYNKYRGIGTHFNVDRYEIEGVVKNNLGRTLDELTVVVRFYDGYRIAGYGYDYIDNLLPSQSTDFKVSVSDYSLSFGYMPDSCTVSAEEGRIRYNKP